MPSTGITAPKQIGNQKASALHANASVTALVVHSVDQDGNYVSPGAGSTQVSIKEIQTSSGASVMDSTNNSIGVTIRAGSAGGTEYTDGDVDASVSGGAILFDNSSNTLRPVTINRGLPVNVVANIAPLSSGVVGSNSSAINVRVVGGVSSAVDFPVSTGPYSISSVGGVVTVSTGPFAVSSVGGIVTISTGPFQISSIVGVVSVSTGPMQVSSVGGVLMSRLQDSSGVGIAGSTGPTAVGVNGLVTREVMPTMQSTTVLITSSHSTALYSLISSVAGQRQKVYAYFISSTHTNPSTLVFMSSNTIDRWHVGFGSGSSGMTGANLALSPPSWLFHTDAANALNVRIEGGSSITSTVIARISLAWFSEA